MTINDVDISTMGAVQHHVDIGHAEVKNGSTWVNAALLPHFENGYLGFKQIDIDFLVRGASREDIINKRGQLLSQFVAPVDLVLDGFTHRFKVAMKSHKEDEMIMRRTHKVSVSLLGYEYGTEVIATGTSRISTSNPGTLVSPVRLEITPNANASNVTITGLVRNPRTGADMPVQIGSMTKSKVITLDGANGLFTEDGALKPDIDIQHPPGVAPGAVTVTCSSPTAIMAMSILPLYM